MKKTILTKCAALFVLVSFVTSSFSGVSDHFTSTDKRVLARRVNLAVVLVSAWGKQSGKLLDGLSAEDFEVFDNGNLADISYFRQESTTEPIAFWLVVECSQKHAEEKVAAVSAHELLGPALKELNSGDKIGVAHFCRHQGQYVINQAATSDRQAAEAALSSALNSTSIESDESGDNESLRAVLSLIHRQTSDSDSEPRPIVVFLGPGGTGQRKEETTHLSREVLSHTSLTVYAIDDGDTRSIATFRSRFSPIAYLCQETGGQVLSANGPKWGDALGQIVNEAHVRYLLAYMPPQFDLGWHSIKIKLAARANRKYGRTLLRYRSGYLGVGNPLRFSVTEVPRGPDYSLDLLPNEALAGTTGTSQIPFDVEGATYEGPSRSARLTLKLSDDNPLSWTELPDGNHCSGVTLMIAFLSAQRELIGRKVRAFEIVRRPNDSWTRVNQRIVIDNYLEYPSGADRIRLIIRDDATGRIGEKDVPMQEILEAPKLHNIIARQFSGKLPRDVDGRVTRSDRQPVRAES